MRRPLASACSSQFSAQTSQPTLCGRDRRLARIANSCLLSTKFLACLCPSSEARVDGLHQSEIRKCLSSASVACSPADWARLSTSSPCPCRYCSTIRTTSAIKSFFSLSVTCPFVRPDACGSDEGNKALLDRTEVAKLLIKMPGQQAHGVFQLASGAERAFAEKCRPWCRSQSRRSGKGSRSPAGGRVRGAADDRS
jgi:hypothetical protein